MLQIKKINLLQIKKICTFPVNKGLASKQILVLVSILNPNFGQNRKIFNLSVSAEIWVVDTETEMHTETKILAETDTETFRSLVTIDWTDVVEQNNCRIYKKKKNYFIFKHLC